jgi:hypothetical protein
LQGVAVGYLVAAGAGGGVVAVDGLVAKVEVSAVSDLAGDGTGNHAVAAGADGGEVGVAAIAPGVDLVDADAVAAQYFAIGDELALYVAALVDVQGAPGDVVDQAAVVAGLGVVADACQVAVGVVLAAAGAGGEQAAGAAGGDLFVGLAPLQADGVGVGELALVVAGVVAGQAVGGQVACRVVAAFVADGVFGGVVAFPDALPQQAAVVVKAVDPRLAAVAGVGAAATAGAVQGVGWALPTLSASSPTEDSTSSYEVNSI